MRDIDKVVQQVRARLPTVEWSQLQVKHPGVDDDGVWFFRLPDTGLEVQLESTLGTCPFLIESTAHRQRQQGATIERTVELTLAWLQAKNAPPLMNLVLLTSTVRWPVDW